MTKYKIYNVTTDITAGKFIEKEMDTSDYSDVSILTWQNKKSKTNILNRPVLESYKFTGDLEKVKTYYFVPGTVFDRDYFKRLYPDLTYTRIIKNVDLVIYGPETGNKFVNNTKVIHNYHGSHVDDNTKSIYLFDSYNTRMGYLRKNNTWLSYTYDDIILYSKNGRKDALGKMISVEDLFSAKKSNITTDTISLQSIGQLPIQLANRDEKIVKSAMDCVLNYSNDYLLTQLTLLSLISVSKSIFSGKAKFFYNTNKHRMFFRTKYYGNTLIEYVESLNRIANNFPFKAKDIGLVNEIINSPEFQKIWRDKTSLEYSVKFKIVGEPIPDDTVSSDSSLPEFAV